MNFTAERFKFYAAVLALIDKRRAETGDPCLGAGIEQKILDIQFKELETEILENPGPLEPWLVRRRKQ